MNEHLTHVYELYYAAFEKLRKVPEIKTLEDNDKFCVSHLYYLDIRLTDSIVQSVMKECLTDHLTVIPRLAMGVLEIQESVPSEDCDRLMTTLLRAVGII